MLCLRQKAMSTVYIVAADESHIGQKICYLNFYVQKVHQTHCGWQWYALTKQNEYNWPALSRGRIFSSMAPPAL